MSLLSTLRRSNFTGLKESRVADQYPVHLKKHRPFEVVLRQFLAKLATNSKPKASNLKTTNSSRNLEQLQELAFEMQRAAMVETPDSVGAVFGAIQAADRQLEDNAILNILLDICEHSLYPNTHHLELSSLAFIYRCMSEMSHLFPVHHPLRKKVHEDVGNKLKSLDVSKLHEGYLSTLPRNGASSVEEAQIRNLTSILYALKSYGLSREHGRVLSVLTNALQIYGESVSWWTWGQLLSVLEVKGEVNDESWGNVLSLLTNKSGSSCVESPTALEVVKICTYLSPLTQMKNKRLKGQAIDVVRSLWPHLIKNNASVDVISISSLAIMTRRFGLKSEGKFIPQLLLQNFIPDFYFMDNASGLVQQDKADRPSAQNLEKEKAYYHLVTSVATNPLKTFAPFTRCLATVMYASKALGQQLPPALVMKALLYFCSPHQILSNGVQLPSGHVVDRASGVDLFSLLDTLTHISTQKRYRDELREYFDKTNQKDIFALTHNNKSLPLKVTCFDEALVAARFAILDALVNILEKSLHRWKKVTNNTKTDEQKTQSKAASRPMRKGTSAEDELVGAARHLYLALGQTPQMMHHVPALVPVIAKGMELLCEVPILPESLEPVVSLLSSLPQLASDEVLKEKVTQHCMSLVTQHQNMLSVLDKVFMLKVIADSPAMLAEAATKGTALNTLLLSQVQDLSKAADHNQHQTNNNSNTTPRARLRTARAAAHLLAGTSTTSGQIKWPAPVEEGLREMIASALPALEATFSAFSLDSEVSLGNVFDLVIAAEVISSLGSVPALRPIFPHDQTIPSKLGLKLAQVVYNSQVNSAEPNTELLAATVAACSLTHLRHDGLAKLTSQHLLAPENNTKTTDLTQQWRVLFHLAKMGFGPCPMESALDPESNLLNESVSLDSLTVENDIFNFLRNLKVEQGTENGQDVNKSNKNNSSELAWRIFTLAQMTQKHADSVPVRVWQTYIDRIQQTMMGPMDIPVWLNNVTMRSQLLHAFLTLAQCAPSYVSQLTLSQLQTLVGVVRVCEQQQTQNPISSEKQFSSNKMNDSVLSVLSTLAAREHENSTLKRISNFQTEVPVYDFSLDIAFTTKNQKQKINTYKKSERTM